jgi:uncharacterized membrane protein (DUF2068 family)
MNASQPSSADPHPHHTVTELWHPRNAPRGWVGLEVIAVFKIVKAAGLIIAGLGALGLLNAGRANAAEDWLEGLSLREGHHLLSHLAGKGLQLLQNATPKQILVAAAGSFLYAAIFLVEGIGLWRCKRWAEYLTISVTASLLPFEIFAVARERTPIRLGAVVLNLAVVLYLWWQLNETRPDANRAHS